MKYLVASIFTVLLVLVWADFYARHHPNSAAPNHCLEWPKDESHQIICNIEGTPFMSERCSKVCHYDDPPRWVVTTTVGQEITVVGGECYTAYRGR